MNSLGPNFACLDDFLLSRTHFNSVYLGAVDSSRSEICPTLDVGAFNWRRHISVGLSCSSIVKVQLRVQLLALVPFVSSLIDANGLRIWIVCCRLSTVDCRLSVRGTVLFSVQSTRSLGWRRTIKTIGRPECIVYHWSHSKLRAEDEDSGRAIARSRRVAQPCSGRLLVLIDDIFQILSMSALAHTTHESYQSIATRVLLVWNPLGHTTIHFKDET